MSTKPSLGRFEIIFDDQPQILERARTYWKNDQVSGLEEIAPSLFHAQVTGSDSSPYDVDIRLDPERRIMSTACTCPYQRTPYCKHVGAVLYALRTMLGEDVKPPNTDDPPEPTVQLPHETLDGILYDIDERIRQSDGTHLLLFWSLDNLAGAKTLIVPEGHEQPLIPAQEAIAFVLGIMDHYHQRYHDPDSSSEHSDDHAPDDGQDDDNPYAEVLDRVYLVSGNALQSTNYVSACHTLAFCVQSLCAFRGVVPKGHQALDGFINSLITRVCWYMDIVAQYADSATAGRALSEITSIAREPDMQFGSTTEAVLLMSSALAFARYDDKRMWAYDAIETALSEWHERHDHELDDTQAKQRRSMRQALNIIAYDMYQLSDDEDGCRALWEANQYDGSLTLAHAALQMRRQQFQLARQTIERFLRAYGDVTRADQNARYTVMFDERLTHGWHTLLEGCAEGLNDVDALVDIYWYYIVSCNDKRDIPYLGKLRRLLESLGPFDGSEDTQVDSPHSEHDAKEIGDTGVWTRIVPDLAYDCARNVSERITTTERMMSEDGGYTHHSRWRNPAYEQLIVNERLSDDALVYCATISYPPLPLLQTMAIDHADVARRIILDAMPVGAVPIGAVPGKRNRFSRYGITMNMPLSSRRAVYRQIAKQLRRYETVFTHDEARELAHAIVDQYPNRPALRQELAFML